MTLPPFRRLAVLAQSESGKSTLAQWLGYGFARAGRRTIYANVTGETWPAWALGFSDMEKFRAKVFSSRNLFVCVDEGGDTIARDPRNNALFTRIRHCGHVLAVCVHRMKQLLPVQRDQMDAFALFRMDRTDADELARELAEPRIIGATELGRFEFLYVKRFAGEGGQHFVEKCKAPPPVW